MQYVGTCEQEVLMPEPITTTSPAAELAALKQEADQKGKEVEVLKARIAELTKTVGDLEKKEKEFEKAAANVEQQKKDLECFANTRKPRLEQTVAKAAIVQLKNEATGNLDALSEAVCDAKARIASSATALDAAKAATAQKQAEFAEVTSIPESNNQVLKDLLSLKADADKEDAANNLGRMYFLLLLMETVLAICRSSPPPIT
jgi:chromosome segregation ATPase